MDRPAGQPHRRPGRRRADGRQPVGLHPADAGPALQRRPFPRSGNARTQPRPFAYAQPDGAGVPPPPLHHDRPLCGRAPGLLERHPAAVEPGRHDRDDGRRPAAPPPLLRALPPAPAVRRVFLRHPQQPVYLPAAGRADPLPDHGRHRHFPPSGDGRMAPHPGGTRSGLALCDRPVRTNFKQALFGIVNIFVSLRARIFTTFAAR